MLKHTSTAGGPTANGQIRSATMTSTARNIHLRPPQPLNLSLLNASSLSTATSTATTTNTVNGTTVGTNGISSSSNSGGSGRLSNLLNISPKLATSTANSVSTANATATATAGVGSNGGSAPLIPSLSNASSNGAMSSTTTTYTNHVTSATTPNGLLNGIGNNLHTYTNQHMVLSQTVTNDRTCITTPAINSNNNINTNANATNNMNYMFNNSNHNNLPLTSIPNHNLHQHSNQLKGQLQLQQHQHQHQHQHQQNTAANNTHLYNTHYANCSTHTGVLINQSKHGPGPREALTSLGLLCLVSLLLALLSLIFLLKISPHSREDALTRHSPDDFIIVYDITLALCAISLSLNLYCLLVCAIQFLFAVKLVRSPMFDGRDNRYLEKSSTSRICAVGGFFISIPIFLTGIILYTFNNFHSTPAITTSILIGIAIVFCGAAMVHNVFVWQREKTISYRNPPTLHQHLQSSLFPAHIGPITPPQQFLNPANPQLNCNHSNASVLLQPTSITPVSPNHSHGSFNPLTTLSSTFLMRPSTATPPTPKPLANGYVTQLSNGGIAAVGTGTGTIGNCTVGREASGSISPGLPATLDMSNIVPSNSLHELSTLV